MTTCYSVDSESRPVRGDCHQPFTTGPSVAPAGLSTSESSLPRFFTRFQSGATLTARMTASAPGSFVGRKLQLLAPVLGRERAAHPRRNRVHDVVYRVPAGEERGLVGGSGLRHTEMDVAVAEMAKAGDARTGVDRLACPRQALRARRNSSRFACTSASTRRNGAEAAPRTTMGRPACGTS
jgi:hypothetical protein